LRCVVDDEVDAGQILQSADVAPFPSDDAALHVVRGKLDDRDGGLCRVACGNPLECVRDQIPRAPLGLGPRFLFHLPHHASHLVTHELL
jgi:hypothetical protein